MANYTILVVDDEEINQTIIRSILLRKSKYEVVVAGDGEVAVTKLDEKNYDLIITDLRMPGVDGIGVLDHAKKNNANALVMIMTSYGSLESAIDALRLGAVDYMLKPFDNGEFMLRVEKCFERFELQKKVKIYEDILPVCCKCNKIRDDDGKEPGTGDWMPVDAYLTEKAKLNLSHGYCNECYREQKEEINNMKKV